MNPGALNSELNFFAIHYHLLRRIDAELYDVPVDAKDFYDDIAIDNDALFNLSRQD